MSRDATQRSRQRRHLPYWRLTSLVLIVWTAVTLTVLLVGRSQQEPLPPLLYSSQGDLVLLHVGCAEFFANCEPDERVLLDGLHQTRSPASWSPDGAYIAVRLIDERFYIFRADCLLGGADSCERVPLPGGGSFRVAWGPDGTTLAHLAGDPSDVTIYIRTRGCWDETVATSCMTWQAETQVMFLAQPDWSADGSTMVFTAPSPQPGIWTLDVGCFARPRTCADALTLINNDFTLNPEISADGSRLIYEKKNANSFGGQVFLLDLATGQGRQLTDRGSLDTVHPAWSPDERYVAFAGLSYDYLPDGDMHIFLLDLERGLTGRASGDAFSRALFPAWGAPGSATQRE